jgi:hypothetical protein
MQRKRWHFILAQTCAYWNWKCALLSAAVRSLVYLLAMARSGSLTSGIYAGMQQRALALRSRQLGNLVIALGVPALAQFLDWLAHHAVGPAAPHKALFAVCMFTLISGLFHLHIMRRGVFLTGHAGRTLAADFRRMPRLILDFIRSPIALLSALNGRIARSAESEIAL